MTVKIHLQILFYASLVWVLFFLIGMPDYYLQYSTKAQLSRNQRSKSSEIVEGKSIKFTY